MSECNSYYTTGKEYYRKAPTLTKSERTWDNFLNTECKNSGVSVLTRNIVESNIRAYIKVSLDEQFKLYSQNWKNETRGFSTILHKVQNDNYLDIIGIGEPAIKFILEDIQKQSSFLFIALKHLVKVHMNEVSPVTKDDLGNVKKMINAWVLWGKSKNIIK